MTPHLSMGSGQACRETAPSLLGLATPWRGEGFVGDRATPPAAVLRGTWTLRTPRDLVEARRAVRAEMNECAPEDEGAGSSTQVTADLLLVLDELGSNALRHAPAPVVLQLARRTGAWLIVATDAAPNVLPVPAIGRPREFGGMGLSLIAELSNRHGVHRDAHRKSVWALVS